MNVVTLDTIVRELLFAEGKDSLHDYRRYLQFAINGLKELYYNADGIQTVVELPVSDNGVVDIPQDCLKINRVCIVDSNNYLRELTPNANISIKKNNDTDCTDNQDVAIGGGRYEAGLGDYTTAHFAWNQQMGRFYGLTPQNTYGEYRIDLVNNVITLSPRIPYTSIVLEYLGNPQLTNGKFGIHPYAVDCLKKWIYYDRIRFKKGVSRGEKDSAHRDFLTSRINYISSRNMPSMEAIKAASRKSYKSSPRY